ncbi:hypothetical protein K1719_046276 [Acacia pycnantha]|nr:hypothetical protein K1719_046276 [Acacia pycnantha]
MTTMNDDESLQIFSKQAFNKNGPQEKYLEYSKSVVQYAGGLPLALQALGSYLGSGDIEAIVMEDWPEDEYWLKLNKIKQLWNGIKSMNHLKFIDPSGSPDFIKLQISQPVQSLEHLRLSRCASLVKVHESLGVLKELVEVDLHDCENLNNLPSKLETNSLRKLDLGRCKNVRKLPSLGTGCECLVSLPRLPPQLTRLEANGCYSMKRSLDEQLLNLVTSLDHECREQTNMTLRLS